MASGLHHIEDKGFHTISVSHESYDDDVQPTGRWPMELWWSTPTANALCINPPTGTRLGPEHVNGLG